MKENDICVKAHRLGKCYRIFSSPRARLAQSLVGNRKRYYEEKWALREVSFTLSAGRTLGIVGRNGSGKSTLLQLLCGTLTPTEGSVRCNGRVAALLELGSGFNPEFTGLENIFVNAALLGLNREQTEAKLDSILAFADIGDYVKQPVKTYSSGMALRLAFAVQANMEPEILIVDEALAVGDELFQRKCFSRLSELKENGTSILLVSHSCPQIIQHCDEALLLHKGKAMLTGKPSVITSTYQQLAKASDKEWTAVIDRKREALLRIAKGHEHSSVVGKERASERYDEALIPKSREVYKSWGVEICDVRIETPEGTLQNQIPFRSAFQLRFSYRTSGDFSMQSIRCRCHIVSVEGLRVTGQAFPLGDEVFTVGHDESWDLVFSFGPGLHPGVYFVGGGVLPSDTPGSFLHRVVDYAAFRILANAGEASVGICDLSTTPPELISHPGVLE